MERRHDGSHGDDCYGCRIQTIQVSPSAMPTRRNNVAPARSMNNWEKGIKRWDDGTPLRVDGRCVGLKEYSDSPTRYERIMREQVQGLTPRDRVVVTT